MPPGATSRSPSPRTAPMSRVRPYCLSQVDCLETHNFTTEISENDHCYQPQTAPTRRARFQTMGEIKKRLAVVQKEYLATGDTRKSYDFTLERHEPRAQCDRKLAEWYAVTYGNSTNDTKLDVELEKYASSNQLALTALRVVVRILTMMNLPTMLVYGSLLGWYRHCGTIPYTSDIDLMIDFSDMMNDEHYELVEDAFRLFGFQELRIYGRPTKSGSYFTLLWFDAEQHASLKAMSPTKRKAILGTDIPQNELLPFLALREMPLTLDVFVGEFSGEFLTGHSWYGSQIVFGYDEINTGFRLADFEGIDVYVPAQPRVVLEWLYPNFTHPKGDQAGHYFYYYEQVEVPKGEGSAETHYNAFTAYSFRALCPPHKTYCPSYFARGEQREMLLASFDKIAKSIQLAYHRMFTQLLQYPTIHRGILDLIKNPNMDPLRLPPTSEVLLLAAADLTAVKRELMILSRRSTYTLEFTASASCRMRFKFSRASNVSLLLCGVPNLDVALTTNPPQYYLPSETVKAIEQCRECNSQRLALVRTRMRNSKFPLCLTSSKDHRLTAEPCFVALEPWVYTNTLQLMLPDGSCLGYRIDEYFSHILELVLECWGTTLAAGQWLWDPSTHLFVHLASSMCLELAVADDVNLNRRNFTLPLRRCDPSNPAQIWQAS
eukprot:m.432073 g.432073  ORF g.432073 m.432073 type:complete len:661 (+) comp56746_c0_seq5:2185-4167(+)